MIYLDHNATTPLLPAVLAQMQPFLGEHFGNASSSHAFGRRAREAIEGARARVAALLGASPDEVVFTSGGTEASNLAIRGVAAARPERRRLVTSAIEHPATASPCAWLARQGWQLGLAAVDPSGRVDPGALDALLAADTALVSVIHAHNETGVLQPIAQIAERARRVGAVMHADAAQSFGKLPVRVDELGVDLLSIAGHKLYAPQGVGALYVRRGTPIEPLLRGASHERGLRPGTENAAGIVGLGAAAAIALEDQEQVAERVAALRDELWARLRAEIDGLERVAAGAPTLPNTLLALFPGASGGAVLARAPEVAASTGSACHDGRDGAPDVLLEMGIPAERARGAVRLTLGRGTTEDDVRRAAPALARAWRAARTQP